MKWIKKTGVIASVVVVSGILINAVSTKTTEKAAEEKVTTAFYFPAKIDFAGESAPLNVADVKERFDRELLVNANLHATTQIIIKRANRAFTVIEPILKKNGVPDDFKYLAVAESGLVNAVSSAGARGVWQFMPETGKQYGLEIDDLIDERYHLEKSTEAACKYLLNAKEKLGSWTLAAASYNAGLAGVNRQLTFQGVNDYYDLLLNDETSRYVFRILALKQIMKEPAKYNFYLAEGDMYPVLPVKNITVSSSIPDLAVFAKEQGINYKILKIHNPWLRDRKLNVTSGKEYSVEIPLSGY
ncbi:lytic transglycosylase domain-containing protein [Flavobacterium salilacus subsp. salilacus]|uniref:lytic transglycosylase domain-containing protein n=1 Tax=Flavobacterium TaxID=237 RepID=UPI00107577F3|nr:MULTISPECIES: lytic transglycosylase domain-containing protein [Flavobacterium]KAF2518490.1 lytic transglycosylase domain-containing protein [Flavobacterium salilacus subsp. salilacus]MBE1615130.1 lytic transglycosylase domain-containing protein [Flavobacterium sp. SaA2.13]NDI98121.1 lytic transglycosylase domain-containing protein [Flavobacterium salilacus subsp. altitudinum]